ncbi:MAG: universal stress protein [Desulfobacterales bacterium]|nr:universal stress protein [Desulfobacterales bacterium]
MRILAAVDQYPYSVVAVEEVAKLALNTWADVTLIGVGPKLTSKRFRSGEFSAAQALDQSFKDAIRRYREHFLSYFQGEDSPYQQQRCGYEFIEVEKGRWEELYVCRGARKDLKVRIRQGKPAAEILAESYEEGVDLIVIACDQALNCTWQGIADIPQKIANDAACSVLVVKEAPKINRMVCFLDHDRVSQASLEMINQMVTLHHVELELVGVTTGEALRADVEKKMDLVMRYYSARNIKSWIKLVEIIDFETFIKQEAQGSLVALWMGEKSILEKFFPMKKVVRLIRASQSSVLILR